MFCIQYGILYYFHRLCVLGLATITRPAQPMPSSVKLLISMAFHKGKSCTFRYIRAVYTISHIVMKVTSPIALNLPLQ